MQTYDVAENGLRGLNSALQAQSAETNQTNWEVQNPKGSHAIAVGLDAPIEVTVKRLDRVLLRGHEPAGDRQGRRLGGTGCGRKHDVGHRDR